jgi:hypothetical protein
MTKETTEKGKKGLVVTVQMTNTWGYKIGSQWEATLEEAVRKNRWVAKLKSGLDMWVLCEYRDEKEEWTACGYEYKQPITQWM